MLSLVMAEVERMAKSQRTKCRSCSGVKDDWIMTRYSQRWAKCASVCSQPRKPVNTGAVGDYQPGFRTIQVYPKDLRAAQASLKCRQDRRARSGRVGTPCR